MPRLRPLVLLLLATTAGADPRRSSPQADLEAFRSRAGAGWRLTPSADGVRLQGGSLGFLPERAGHLSSRSWEEEFQARALEFVHEHASLLGADAATLRPALGGLVGSADGTLHVLHLEQAPHGVPVLGSRVSFVVSRGRLLSVSASGLRPAGAARGGAESARPALDERAAVASAAAAAGPGLALGARRVALVFVPDADDLRLAWRVELLPVGGDARPRRLVALVDAASGDILSMSDEVRDTCAPAPPGGLERRVLGGVRPERADEPERIELLPFASVGSSAAGADGFFAPPAAPHAATLSGPVADVTCAACRQPASIGAGPLPSGDIDFGSGGADEAGNGTSTPADRAAFLHVEGARRLAASRLALPFLQQPVRVVTNSPLSCNAYWDGSALTFFRSSARCGNSGEIRDVIVHEYGHALDEHDGWAPPPVAVDAATGEAIADILAMLRSRDACIGESFFASPADWPSAACSGVRDLDERAPGHRRGTLDASSLAAACATSSHYRGVLGFEGHCEGELLGQAFFHLVENLRTGVSRTDGRALPSGPLGEDAAWLLAETLFFRALPLIASQAPTSQQSLGPSAHEALLLADDEGDGIANGTPHAEEIHDALAHHGLAEPGAPATSSARCTPPAAPGVTATEAIDATSGLPIVRLDWTDGGAASHRILRADAGTEGWLPVASALGPGAGSFTDRAVLPGRSYAYVIVAEGASGCAAASARAIAGTGPRLEVALLALDDGGDGLLAPGESADLRVDLINRGGSPATNARLEIVSADPSLVVLAGGPLSYGSVAPGAVASAPGAFRVQATPSASGLVRLVLDGESDEGCQRSEQFLRIAEPALRLAGQALDDAGGGDGDASWEPGEGAELALDLVNDGTLPASDIQASLSLRPGAPAGITIAQGSGSWPDLAPGAAASQQAPPFALLADASVPARARVPARLDIRLGGLPHASFDLDLEMGGLPPGSLEWFSAAGVDHGVNPVVIPLDDDDGDGRITACDGPDIVVRAGWGAGASLVAFEGADGAEIWRVADPCFNTASGSQLAAGDVDGDGWNEIVVMSRQGETCAVASDGTMKWRATVVAQASQVAGANDRGAAPQVRDLDGDGVAEIVVGYTVLDGRDGSLVWEKFVNNRGQVLVADLDLDGSDEILAGVEPQGAVPADTRAWRADGSRFGVTFPGLFWGSAAADLDGDPGPEIVWVDTTTGVNAANPDGSLVFPRWEAAPLTQIIGSYQPCLADFDGDGLSEIGVAVQGRVVVLDGDGTEAWSAPADSDWFGACSAFDFDRDGRAELVHHDRSRLRIMDGRDGSVRWEASSPVPYDPWQGPVIADVDGDGAAEIVTVGGAGPFDGRVEVHGHPAWAAARRAWNGQGYSAGVIGEDGSVPAPAEPWWLTGNGHRQQAGACPCAAVPASIRHAVACGTFTACFEVAPLSPGDTVAWDFGDGSPPAAGARTCHDFGSPGPRVVRATLRDAAGCASESALALDLPEPLAVSIVLPAACAGASACARAVVSGGAGSADVTWTLPDGSPASGADLCRAWIAGTHRLVARAIDPTGCSVEVTAELVVQGPPRSVGAALRATGHGDPRAPDCEATFDWSRDEGAPRDAGESFMVLRGTEPRALGPLPVGAGSFTAFTDSTPATPAANLPRVHYYSVVASGPCGTSLD